MSLLIFNAGSSTLKCSLTDATGEQTFARAVVDRSSRPATYVWDAEGKPPVQETGEWSEPRLAVERIVESARALIDASPHAGAIETVSHRVVHGGSRFTGAVVVDASVRAALAEVSALAPLHNPPSLHVIDAAMKALPNVPHVAVFDTAFHATLAPEAYTYALPFEWSARWGLRRFGFHGLSHAYCANRAAELAGRAPEGFRVIVAHLGNGASVSAVDSGRSVATTMGFTPVEGLMMGTRSGSVDPGLLMHLMIGCGVPADELQHTLNYSSGLLGVSGLSADMRAVLRAAKAGHERAALAVSMFVDRARQAIGALAVTLGQVDALVFTAGIGEHSAEIRAAICNGLECLGLELDAEVNASARPDARLSPPDSRGIILVVRTREDLMMARAAFACTST